jgi:hypothetical protein
VSERPSKRDCEGCRDDHYNHVDMGLNMSTGKPQCWNLDGAIFAMRLEIPVSLPPPYKGIKPKRVPSCRRTKGVVYVSPDALNSSGYWK